MTTSNKKNVSHPTTTQALIFNVLEIAEQLEEIIKPYAAPYQPGIYLPDSLEPVLVPGGAYFYEVINTTPVAYRYVPVSNIQATLAEPWDILDAPEGNVVVTHAQLRSASETPKLPIRGLKLIHDIIFNIVFSPLAHGHYPKYEKSDVIKKHLAAREKLQGVIGETSRDETANHTWVQFLNKVADQAYAPCAELLRYIHTFIGEKGMYAMYELNFQTSTELSLVYTGDFRIVDWHRRMEEGSWA